MENNLGTSPKKIEKIVIHIEILNIFKICS